MRMKLSFLLLSLAIIALFVWLPTPPSNKNEMTSSNSATSETISKSGEKAMQVSQQSENQLASFLLQNVRLFDGEKIRSHMNVKVKAGRIVSILPFQPQANSTKRINSEHINSGMIIDGNGKTLLPGLIDAHVHSWGNSLQQGLEFGITSQMDMFADPNWVKQQKQLSHSQQLQSDIFSAGILVTAPKGHGTEYGFPIPTISSAKEAGQFVVDRISEGSDYIKIVYESKEVTGALFPSISKATLKAVIAAAHQHNKLAVVHAQYYQSARDAIAAGADGLVHMVMDKLVDDQFIALAKQNSIFIIPTLSVYTSLMPKTEKSAFVDQLISPKNLSALTESALNNNIISSLERRFDSQPAGSVMWPIVIENTRRLYQAGVPILAGTDAPNPGTSYGISLHGELRLLVAAGLSPVDALKAATLQVNQSFHLQDAPYPGKIVENQMATMILVNGDPSTQIEATSKIARIWKDGYSVAAYSNKTEEKNDDTPPLDATKQRFTFAGLNSAKLSQIGFHPTSDQQMGGQSSASIEVLSDNNNEWLTVTGEVKPGFFVPWAGAILILNDKFETPVNIEQYDKLNFSVRTSLREISLMFFSNNMPRPIIKNVKITPTGGAKWQTMDIDLTQIDGLNRSSVSAISWNAGTSAMGKNFRIELDDITFISDNRH